MFALSLIAAASLFGTYADDAEAARADFAVYGHDARYLWLGAIPEADHEQALDALEGFLPHVSRASVIDHQRPVQVTPTLYRIDLRLLQWGEQAWKQLALEYPYVDFHDPLIIRADWFLRVTADLSDSQAYHFLLYAETGVPKNKADFLRIWGIDEKAVKEQLTATIIDEGRSGVAFKTRVVAHAPAPTGYFWETFDSREGAGTDDPLENPAVRNTFDAQEAIVGTTEFDLATGERGVSQVYALFDANGNIQNEAPTDIVEDKLKFLGQPAIRSPGSCIMCHTALNGPAENTLRDWIAEGIELSAKQKETQEFVERFYLSKQGLLIERANEDFAAFTEAAANCVPGDFQRAYRQTVEAYDRPVSLERAAVEVGARDAEELKLAIAWYSSRIGPAPQVARLASLAHGRAVPRKSFEGEKKDGHIVRYGVYSYAVKALETWRAK